MLFTFHCTMTLNLISWEDAKSGCFFFPSLSFFHSPKTWHHFSNSPSTCTLRIIHDISQDLMNAMFYTWQMPPQNHSETHVCLFTCKAQLSEWRTHVGWHITPATLYSNEMQWSSIDRDWHASHSNFLDPPSFFISMHRNIKSAFECSSFMIWLDMTSIMMMRIWKDETHNENELLAACFQLYFSVHNLSLWTRTVHR